MNGSGFLITEGFITSNGLTKMYTIDYLNTFNNLEDLLDLYEQHLNGVEEGNNESGSMISLDEENINDKNYKCK